MLRVLVVEDDNIKYGRIHHALERAGVLGSEISHAITAAQALENLEELNYDLMLLDINIPRRLGEKPIRGGGLKVLSDLRRDPKYRPPRYIVGLTAYEDVIQEFGESFADQLWTLVLYNENTDRWVSQVAAKINYIKAAKQSDYFSDGKTYGVDLAIVCALDTVELAAVKALPCGWQPLRLVHDETRYLTGTIDTKDRALAVMAAAANRMGMSASAVLASKIIAQFRPRALAMVGICAGRAAKTNIGDVIVADPVWDWGSGKIDSVGNEPRFRPSPHQLELDVDFSSRLKEVCLDVGLLARIKSEARGRKPNAELRVHFGPLASGAAVVANRDVFEALLDQHRDLLGIEMEAYGVVVACRGSGKPRPLSVVMKSVCDYADKDKSDDYQEYAAHTSALLLYNAARVAFIDL